MNNIEFEKLNWEQIAKLAAIQKAFTNGEPIVIADSPSREAEGDLMIPASKANSVNLATMIVEGRGLMCCPMSEKILDRLKIPLMVRNNTDKLGTPFCVSVDAKGTKTGMSVTDRLMTLDVLLSETSKPEDLSRPGHLFPLRPKPGLLTEREGHTEATVALLRLFGLPEVGVICELMNDRGGMVTGAGLRLFAENRNYPLITVDEIYNIVYGEKS